MGLGKTPGKSAGESGCRLLPLQEELLRHAGHPGSPPEGQGTMKLPKCQTIPAERGFGAQATAPGRELRASGEAAGPAWVPQGCGTAPSRPLPPVVGACGALGHAGEISAAPSELPAARDPAGAALPRPPGAERGQTTNCQGNGAEEETHLVSSLQLGVELTEDLLQLLPDHVGENIQTPSAKATPPSAASPVLSPSHRAAGGSQGTGLCIFTPPASPELPQNSEAESCSWIRALLTPSPSCQSPGAAVAGCAALLPASAEQHRGHPTPCAEHISVM